MPKKDSDGGIIALSGYLYQVIGLLGMQAAALVPFQDDGEEIIGLLELIHDSGVKHESHGQDAVFEGLGIENSDDCVLVQFKYSSAIPPKEIYRQELINIADGLAASVESVNKRGKTVSAWALVTNRQLAAQAQKTWQETYPQLRIECDIPQKTWEHAIREFAAQYGAVDEEVDRGIQELVGKVFLETGNVPQPSIHKADLVEVFTRSRLAQPLRFETAFEIMDTDIKAFKAGLGMDSEVVRHYLLDEIVKASLERALVILCGDGGRGKTVTLWHWSQNALVSQQAFSFISTARNIPKGWMDEGIRKCRNLAEQRGEHVEDPVRLLMRLHVSNPQIPHPLLYLNLDGLDEISQGSGKHDIVRDLLNWFWREEKRARQNAQPPQATLVVTCRNPEEVLEWLDLDVSGFPYHGERPCEIQVGNFSSEELFLAAQSSSLAPELIAKIETALKSLGNDSQSYSPVLPFETVASSQEPVDITIIEELRYPSVWQAFLNLPEVDRAKLLDGDPNTLRQMAKHFIQRFCRKVSHRHRDHNLRPDTLLDILHNIASLCAMRPVRLYTEADWVDTACHEGLLKRSEARTLYEEALSGGLIINDSKRWRWFAEWVEEYLLNLESDSEIEL